MELEGMAIEPAKNLNGLIQLSAMFASLARPLSQLHIMHEWLFDTAEQYQVSSLIIEHISSALEHARNRSMSMSSV